MTEDDLENKVEHKKGGFGRAMRKLALAGLIGTGAFYAGMRHEMKNDTLHDRHVRNDIKEAALDGYAWKQDSDPTFYEYEAVLHKDSIDKTIQGYMVKVTPTDTINAGPIRQDGRIGYKVHERAKDEAGDMWQDVKRGMRKFKDKASDAWDVTKEALDKGYDRVKDYVGKDEQQDTIMTDTIPGGR
ncbi:hypothetical protein KY327_01515 [Candidatus Woesearchaeota archaeon]|nr:hypothetical protein [Candidatus Woesearchaeota archaeon]